jgi:predicted Zn finger-like uncharacterized protein
MVSGALTNLLLPFGDPAGLDSPMLISCTNCGTSYEAAPDALDPTGRSVRCVCCQRVWLAPNTEAMADIAEAHRTQIAGRRCGLPVNLRGLEFVKVTTETENHDGVPVLVVAGEIANDSKRALEVPRLRFAIRNQGGHEISSWTALPEKNALIAGEALPFVSRLAVPPREGRQVQVHFFNRRDLVAGIQ